MPVTEQNQDWHLYESQLLLATNVSIEMLAQGVQKNHQVCLKVAVFFQSFQRNEWRNVMTADLYYWPQI